MIMLDKLDKGIRIFYRLLLYFLVALILTMLVVCWAHVFFRYVLNDSLTWSEEFMRILLVWFCMLSASVLAIRREHVSIVVFKDMMPKRVSAGLTRFTQILTFAASVLVFVLGIKMVISAGARTTPAMHMPYSWAYAAIPVAFAVISIYELRNVIADFLGGDRAAVVKKSE